MSVAFVQRLVLTQFRNHPRLEIETAGGPVCLFGPNGAGKTNILEALSLLGPGKGLRGADLPDMARKGADGGPFAVSALLDIEGEERRLGVGLDLSGPAPRRVARLDGRDAGPGELAHSVRLIWLTPAYDRLFAGPASDRRRFLDRLVFTVAPEHALSASTFEKAIRERSRMLEEARPDARWLAVVERQAAEAGVALAAARLETVDRLQAEIDARPDGPFPKASLALSGTLEARLREGAGAADVEEAFARGLAVARARDAAAGRALDGPHRSDLEARHTGADMPAGLCSTGEQKALVVGLVLAHARRMAAAAQVGGKAPNPLLLLDEAAAHFDPARRAGLAGELMELPGQAWLTGTDRSQFDGFGAGASLFEVSAGSARRVGH
jgi:DNA replication and repair protein RecF